MRPFSGRSSFSIWFARLCAVLALVLARPAFAGSPAKSGPPADTSYGLPADQPQAHDRAIELPAVPPSFNTYRHGWIDFAYPPSTRPRVEPLIKEADSVRAELSNRLGQKVLSAVHVRIARTPGEMATLAPEGAPYPRYASGVAFSEIGMVLLTLTPPQPNSLGEIDETFRHELAHIALADAVGESRVPRWFNEGLAVHLSGESSLLRLKTLSTASLAGRLIPLERLDQGFAGDAIAADLAYAEAADLVRFLLRREDRERFPALIARIRGGEPFPSALRNAYGLDLPSLEYEWREEVAKRYSFWPVVFSGSLVWAGVLVLFGLAWRRRRNQSRETLERWAREEAYVELRRARQDMTAPASRVHILLPSRDAPPTSDLPALRRIPLDTDVPKVQHDGQWHTLH